MTKRTRKNFNPVAFTTKMIDDIILGLSGNSSYRICGTNWPEQP